MARVKTRRLVVLLALAAVIATVSAIYFYHRYQPWLAAHTGTASGQESGSQYAYWSGFGSVFPWEVGVLAGFLTYVYQHTKKVNCHAHGCPRIGSFPVGEYRVCKKHHHEVTGTHPTIDLLKEVHNGGPCSDPCVDSQPDRDERPPGAQHVGGVHGPGEPADAPDHPPAPGG